MGDGGPAALAQLDEPAGVVVDHAGGIIVADASNRLRHVIFGAITTIAGSGAAKFGGDGGPATDAQLNDPNLLALDAVGGVLIADTLNHRIRRLDRDGTLSTVAGGGFIILRPFSPPDTAPALDILLLEPTAITVDHAGNVFIADTGHHTVLRLDPGGTITSFAGQAESAGFAGDGGPANLALLNTPVGIAVSRRGDVFIAEAHNCTIRRVGPNGRISTIAGSPSFFGGFGGDGGPATAALLSFPTALLLDGDENLLIADSANGRVRSIDRDGIITTVAGGGTETPADGVLATAARFGQPTSLAFDGSGGLIVGDETNHRVWRLIAAAVAPPPPGS